MRIIAEECTRCGLCEIECHRNAIVKNQAGDFIIDEILCDECEGLLDIQCARVCEPNCIVKSQLGQEPARIFFDDVIRLRPDHLLYLIAVMSSANSGKYVGGREWDAQREMIGKAFIDPDVVIRIVPTFDDACIGCEMKKDPRHIERLIWEDKKTLDVAGFHYGQEIKFWDAYKIMKDKITPEYLRGIKKSESFIEYFMSSPAPGQSNTSYMQILQEECIECDKCVNECPLSAISKDEDGKYSIDVAMCDGCAELFDIQCARVCPTSCIVKKGPGSNVERIVFDDIIRVRPDHILYQTAIMGAGNSGRYMAGREWSVMRETIAKAFQNPELEIRIVPTFADACIGCSMKQNPEHVERLTAEDDKTLVKLNYQYGDVVKFWDAIIKARKNITAQYLKDIKKTNIFIEDFMNSITPLSDKS